MWGLSEMDIGKITEPMMEISIQQWCDNKEQILELMLLPVITLKHMYEAGCHWVPAQLPFKANLIEIVSEIHLTNSVFHLVKFSSEHIGTNYGYALLKVM